MIAPSSRYNIGMGHPQYLCLEIPQSLKRNVVFPFPLFTLSNFSIISSFALSTSRPFKNSELINVPSSRYASLLILNSLCLIPLGSITGVTSSLYFLAKSKSR